MRAGFAALTLLFLCVSAPAGARSRDCTKACDTARQGCQMKCSKESNKKECQRHCAKLDELCFGKCPGYKTHHAGGGELPAPDGTEQPDRPEPKDDGNTGTDAN